MRIVICIAGLLVFANQSPAQISIFAFRSGNGCNGGQVGVFGRFHERRLDRIEARSSARHGSGCQGATASAGCQGRQASSGCTGGFGGANRGQFVPGPSYAAPSPFYPGHPDGTYPSLPKKGTKASFESGPLVYVTNGCPNGNCPATVSRRSWGW